MSLELNPAPAISLPSAPSDGQIVVFNAALNAWLAANPTGSSEITPPGINITGVSTTIPNGNPGAAVDIPGCTISVPASTRPVWLYFEFGFGTHDTGVGEIQGLINETTSGTTPLYLTATQLPGVSGEFDTVSGFYRLGTTNSTRTFKLTAQGFKTGATAATIDNGTSTPSTLAALAF